MHARTRTHTLNSACSDLIDGSGWDSSQLSCSDYWFRDLGGLGVQAHTALQLDPFENIAGFWSQAYILEKKQKKTPAVL